MNIAYGDIALGITAYSTAEMYLFKAIAFYNSTLTHMSASEWVVRHVIDSLPVVLTPDMSNLLSELRFVPLDDDDVERNTAAAKELYERYRRLGRAVRS